MHLSDLQGKKNGSQSSSTDKTPRLCIHMDPRVRKPHTIHPYEQEWPWVPKISHPKKLLKTSGEHNSPVQSSPSPFCTPYLASIGGYFPRNHSRRAMQQLKSPTSPPFTTFHEHTYKH